MSDAISVARDLIEEYANDEWPPAERSLNTERLIAGFKAVDSQHQAAVAIVKVTRLHMCLGRREGYNYGCPICGALTAYKVASTKLQR